MPELIGSESLFHLFLSLSDIQMKPLTEVTAKAYYIHPGFLQLYGFNFVISPKKHIVSLS